MPGASVSVASCPAPGSMPPGRDAGLRSRNALLASDAACVAMSNVVVVPSSRQVPFGGGGGDRLGIHGLIKGHGDFLVQRYDARAARGIGGCDSRNGSGREGPGNI